MTWRERYTNKGEVAGLFNDSRYQRVDVEPVPGEGSGCPNTWAIVATANSGRDRITIQGGFESEVAARGFNFDHWSRDRIGIRDEDEQEWER